MPIFTPKKIAVNWYQYDVSFSVDLIRTFVKGIEKHAVDSIHDYRTRKESDEHHGLDRSSWDLDEIFEEHFPSLQRRSALMTLWGFLEHELDKLCYHFPSEKNYKLRLSDLSGKGIDRSTAYLEKVAGLSGLTVSKEWAELKSIQRIRNVIAHDDGRLKDHSGQSKDGIRNDMKRLGSLSGEDEIVVQNGFLSNVLSACDNYFRLVAKIIDENERSDPQPNGRSPVEDQP